MELFYNCGLPHPSLRRKELPGYASFHPIRLCALDPGSSPWAYPLFFDGSETMQRLLMPAMCRPSPPQRATGRTRHPTPYPNRRP